LAGKVRWQQEQMKVSIMEFLRNTIMLGLADQGRIRIRSRKKNEEDSEKTRSEREEKKKLRNFKPAGLSRF
jgi:hypothetical protein